MKASLAKQAERASERSGLIRNIEEMLAVMVAALREVTHWLASLGELPAEPLRADRCIHTA